MPKLTKNLKSPAPKALFERLEGEGHPSCEWFNVVLAGDVANVSIFGIIGWTRSWRELMAQIQGAKDVKLTINSCGGNTATAVELFHALHGRVSEARIIGKCWSAAVPLALSATHIAIERRATMMLHEPCGFVYGPPSQMINAANHLKKFNAYLRKILVERCELSEKIVGAWLHGSTDHYFSGEQAVAVSLADSIFDAPKLDPRTVPVATVAPKTITLPSFTDGELFALEVLGALPNFESVNLQRFLHEAGFVLFSKCTELPKTPNL